MTQRTVSAGSANLPLLLVVGSTAAMLGVRLAEMHGDPLIGLRVLCSLAALAIVFAGRRNLLRSVAFAFALEATAAAFTFVYVDVPFVNAHRAQIGSVALSIHDRIEGVTPAQPSGPANPVR